MHHDDSPALRHYNSLDRAAVSGQNADATRESHMRTTPRNEDKKTVVSLAIATVAVALSACAAAMPGFVPEGSKKSSFERIKPFEAGEVSQSGAYVPSEAERALDCRRLRGSMLIIVAKLRDSGKGPQPSSASRSVQSAVTAVRGKSVMLEPTEESKRERSRLDAYNGLLAEKKCPVMDVAAELSAAAPASPKPSVSTAVSKK